LRFKGLALSLDALFALAFVALMLSLPVVLSQNASDASGLDDLSILGRDYLLLKYLSGKNLTTGNFSSLTGNSLVESAPSTEGRWISATYYQYPNFFNCPTPTSCSFANSSANATYANSQDTGSSYVHSAWVKP